MQLVDIEHIFGGERIVVYYLAEGRVDFRELVRMLAGEFQTRIEMRQIGVRDEAKLMADYGDCGKPVCCNTHLIQMPPVSMKMAKLQKATLDPTKISGRCGRLKCCLRYEYDIYEQLQKELPPIGSRVTTPDGRARVVGHEILAGQLLVETADRVRELIDVAKAIRPPVSPGGRDSPSADANEPIETGRPGQLNAPVPRMTTPCSTRPIRSSNCSRKTRDTRSTRTCSCSRRSTTPRTCWGWAPRRRGESEEEPSDAERHVTGQQLCEAIRQFALEQYGYMAKDVLASWGIHKTGDFGEIVFNLIRIGQMRKTPDDRREDFDDVYDFETAFRRGFKITPPDK